MSYVTNLILHMTMMEEDEERIKEVNAFFTSQRPLVAVDTEELHGWYGGSRYLECNLYIGAFNYLDLEGFLAHLQTITWAEPEAVQVMVREQGEREFHLAYGIPGYDRRVFELEWLLTDAQDWLEDYGKTVSDRWEKEQLQAWQERFKDHMLTRTIRPMTTKNYKDEVLDLLLALLQDYKQAIEQAETLQAVRDKAEALHKRTEGIAWHLNEHRTFYRERYKEL